MWCIAPRGPMVNALLGLVSDPGLTTMGAEPTRNGTLFAGPATTSAGRQPARARRTQMRAIPGT